MAGCDQGTGRELPPPSLSKTGISWAGQTFDGATNGRARGVRQATVVAGSVADGRDLLFTVSVRQLSAALLTVLPTNKMAA